MEDLGIYEVVEEDFALPEYVCVSKINLQEIMRKYRFNDKRNYLVK